VANKVWQLFVACDVLQLVCVANQVLRPFCVEYQVLQLFLCGKSTVATFLSLETFLCGKSVFSVQNVAFLPNGLDLCAKYCTNDVFSE